MKIISNAQKQNRSKGAGEYFENHHILPASLFPNWKKRKSNQVLLTAREHYFCHQLLTKIYPCRAMYFAVFCFMNGKGSNRGDVYKLKISSKEYSFIREKVAKETSERGKSFTGNKNSMYGKHHTFEAKKSMSQKMGDRIICNETNEVFSSIKEAAQKMQLERTSISKQLAGAYKKVNKKYSFTLLDERKRDLASSQKSIACVKSNGVNILCEETGKIYASISEASKDLHIPYRNVRFNTNKTYHFRRIDK